MSTSPMMSMDIAPSRAAPAHFHAASVAARVATQQIAGTNTPNARFFSITPSLANVGFSRQWLRRVPLRRPYEKFRPAVLLDYWFQPTIIGGQNPGQNQIKTSTMATAAVPALALKGAPE